MEASTLSNADSTTCMVHEEVVPTHAQGGGDTVQVGSVGTTDEDKYGPWVVVTRRKNGNKSPKNGSTSASKAFQQDQIRPSFRANYSPGLNSKTREDGLGLKRDGKRKAGPVVPRKVIHGPESVGQTEVNASMGATVKTNANGSVRGKKGIARLRVFSNIEAPSSSNRAPLCPVFSLTKISQSNIDPKFHFSASSETEMGVQSRRKDEKEPGISDRSAVSESERQTIGEKDCRGSADVDQQLENQGVHNDTSGLSNKFGVRSEDHVMQDDSRNVGLLPGFGVRERADEGDAQADRMEFEEGCEHPSSD